MSQWFQGLCWVTDYEQTTLILFIYLFLGLSQWQRTYLMRRSYIHIICQCLQYFTTVYHPWLIISIVLPVFQKTGWCCCDSAPFGKDDCTGLYWRDGSSGNHDWWKMGYWQHCELWWVTTYQPADQSTIFPTALIKSYFLPKILSWSNLQLL